MITINKFNTFHPLFIGALVFLMAIGVYLISANQAFAFNHGGSDAVGNEASGTTEVGESVSGTATETGSAGPTLGIDYSNLCAYCGDLDPVLVGTPTTPTRPICTGVQTCTGGGPEAEFVCTWTFICPPVAPPVPVVPPTPVAAPVAPPTPATLHICPSPISLPKNATLPLEAWYSPLGTPWTNCANANTSGASNVASHSFTTWSSANSGIADIVGSVTKRVRGVEEGITTITARHARTGVDVSDTAGVTVRPPLTPAALHVCPSTSQTMVTGSSLQFTAWETPIGSTFTNCTAPNGINRTFQSMWTSSLPGVATVTTRSSLLGPIGTTGGYVTAGTTLNTQTNIRASYSGRSDFTPVTATCSPTLSCATNPLANSTCIGETFAFTDSCNAAWPSCPGQRNCDFNWKEVAP